MVTGGSHSNPSSLKVVDAMSMYKQEALGSYKYSINCSGKKKGDIVTGGSHSHPSSLKVEDAMSRYQ